MIQQTQAPELEEYQWCLQLGADKSVHHRQAICKDPLVASCIAGDVYTLSQIQPLKKKVKTKQIMCDETTEEDDNNDGEHNI